MNVEDIKYIHEHRSVYLESEGLYGLYSKDIMKQMDEFINKEITRSIKRVIGWRQ